MKSNRRNFIKLTGLAGLGLVGAPILKSHAAHSDLNSDHSANSVNSDRNSDFNMSGYAASKIETVRIGFIGLGNRGPGAVKRMSKIDGVEIKALCDLRPDKAAAAKKLLENTSHNPTIYTGIENEWKKDCDRNDIDLIYIATPWQLHTPMAVYAMEHGKHAASEVPAAVTIEDSWP